jgi:hypothetical protein
MVLKELVVEAFNVLDSLLTPSSYNYRIPTRHMHLHFEDALPNRRAANAGAAMPRPAAEKNLH